MYGKNSDLSGGQELTTIQQKDFNSGNLFDRIIQAINGLAKNAGVAAVGKLPPPPPIQSIAVQGTQSGNVLTAPSETLHWTLNHTQSVDKHVRYFTEIATEPNFLQPHVVDHGASRSGFLHLPSQDSNGNTQAYYIRSFPQYHGSDAQKHTTFGGAAGATKIVMTAPTVTVSNTTYSVPSKTTLLPSTGSGTASNAGQQGGKGLGTVLTRPAPTTKRSVV